MTDIKEKIAMFEKLASEAHHTLLQLKEIEFSDGHVVEKDTTGDFAKPEWQRKRDQAKQAPVCYTRNKPPKLKATFSVVRAPTAAESVEIGGQCNIGGATLEWRASVTVQPADKTIVSPVMTSSANLPDHVACYDPLIIAWEINPANQGWISVGDSRHVFYVTLADPSGTPAYWTLLDISCRAAHGERTEAGVVKKVFVPFSGRSLIRKRDGQGLTYWNPRTTNATNTRELLARGDGSGQCGSWSEFLLDMYKVHGILGGRKIIVVRSVAEWQAAQVGFLVKNWMFKGLGSLASPFRYRMYTECVELPGIAGQRNPNPPPAFFNHFIVAYGGKYYDPSYGGGPFDDQEKWEEGAIDGLFQQSSNGAGKRAAFGAGNILEFHPI